MVTPDSGSKNGFTVISPSSMLLPRTVTLVMDATYFGKRGKGFGLLVAKDSIRKKIIAYDFIEHERIEIYKSFRQRIESQGFRIQAVTLDGRRGIRELFGDIPVQMCHFHQQAILIRYLTRNPKHPAPRDLRRIAGYLGKVSSARFHCLLQAWYTRHKEYLDEKSYSEKDKQWHFAHKRLRSAYRSLIRNHPYLFTYREYPDLHIPNTTNALDGGVFSPLKALLKIHRGIGQELMQKLIIHFLQNQV